MMYLLWNIESCYITTYANINMYFCSITCPFFFVANSSLRRGRAGLKIGGESKGSSITCDELVVVSHGVEVIYVIR